MAKTCILFICCIFTLSICAQSFEYTDGDYKTEYSKIYPVSDSAWVVLSQTFTLSNMGASSVSLFNNQCELQWEYNNPFFLWAWELLVIDDEKIVLFSTEGVCDVTYGVPITVLVLDIEGSTMLNYDIPDVELPNYNTRMKGCVSGNMWFLAAPLYLGSNPYNSQLIASGDDGNVLWVHPLPLNEIRGIATLGENIVVFGENEWVVVDAEGNILETDSYNGPIVDMVEVTDGVLVLFSNGISLLNNDFQWIDVLTEFPEEEAPANMISDEQGIHLVYNHAIYLLDSTFNLISTIETEDLSGLVIRNAAFGNNGYAVVGLREVVTTMRSTFPFQQTLEYVASSGVLRFIPLVSAPQNDAPDVALRHLELSNYQSSQHRIDAGFFLVNEGNVQIDSARVNFISNLNGIICHLNGHATSYYNLQLTPGDSVWLEMDNLMYPYPFGLTPADSGKIEYCIFVSQPNRLYDRVPENDEICGWYDTSVGIESIEELNFSVYPNPAKDILNWSCTNCDVYKTTIQIFSAAGVMVKEIPAAGNSRGTLDLSSWPSGVYFARLNNHPGTPAALRLVVVR